MCTFDLHLRTDAGTRVDPNLHKLISYSIVYRSAKYRLTTDWRTAELRMNNSASEFDGVAATVFARRNAHNFVNRSKALGESNFKNKKKRVL